MTNSIISKPDQYPERERLSMDSMSTGIQGEAFTHALPMGEKCGSRNPWYICVYIYTYSWHWN